MTWAHGIVEGAHYCKLEVVGPGHFCHQLNFLFLFFCKISLNLSLQRFNSLLKFFIIYFIFPFFLLRWAEQQITSKKVVQPLPLKLWDFPLPWRLPIRLIIALKGGMFITIIWVANYLEIYTFTNKFARFSCSVVLARTKDYCSVFHRKIRVCPIFFFKDFVHSLTITLFFSRATHGPKSSRGCHCGWR